MKKSLFLFLLLTVVVFHFYRSLRAQVYSETPVTISENGERSSNMIYVKLKSCGFVEIPEGRENVDGYSISSKFSAIRKTIADFCTNQQLDLSNLTVSKAILDAKEEDTLFTDVKTGEIRKLPNLARVFIIDFPKQVDIETIISELSKYEKVEYAHGPVQLVDCAEYPNDQYYANGGQWYLNTISAPEAWGISKGNADIKIALIETKGVELTHSDLQSKIAGGDNNPAGIISGHGTWVAGFAGAVTNNSIGVASVGWNIKLLTYQPPVYDDDDRTGLAQKIKDAADAGAHVINLSFKTIKTGFTSCTPLPKSSGNNNSTLAREYYYNWDYGLVRNAITYAVGKNSVVIAATGNTNNAIGYVLPCESIPYPCYPAQYSNVIAVSGSQQDNNFVDDWNYGSFIDVNAPGRTDASTGLWSTDISNSYTNDKSKTSGTSFAAPQVSGLAALIKSINVSLTPSQVKSILENSADKVGQYSYTSGKNNRFGYGRINAYKALKYTLENYGGTLTQDLIISSGETWKFKEGVTLKFASGKKLRVYGTLDAQGTESDPIVFTRDDPNSTNKQYWQGVIINSGGSYTFDYVEMSGASNGIKPNYTSGTISNSHFEQNYIGTYLYHANNTNIHNCEFIDNQFGTAALYSSNLNFQNNSYNSNDYYGIYFNRSTGTFKNNVVENNSFHGFYINNQCDVDMNTWFEYGDDPSINNTIQNNASNGMWIGDGDIDLGTYLNIGTDFRGGFNYFNHGSGYLDIRYRGDDDMKAEANWWEDMAIDWDHGEIDTNPTANDLGYSLPKSVNGRDSDYTDDLLNQAYYLEKVDSNYVDAIYILNKAADLALDVPVAQKIVLRLSRLYSKLSNRKGLLKNLDELYNNYPDQLIGITAYDHSVTLFADELNFDEALERSNKLIEKYANLSGYNEKNAWALFEQGMLYMDTKGKLSNNAQAQSSFTKLLRDFSESEAAFILTELYNIEVPKNKANEQIQNFSLLPPSPNPSNPNTTLKFILSEESKVSMVIYDIMGHEVWTLNNGLSSKYSKGYHSMVWHGVDNKGKPLASGIYIVVMITPNFRQSQKILLLK